MAGLRYRKTKVVLSFKKDKPQMYKIAQITMPQITFTQLVEEVAQTQGCTEAQTRAVVNALVNRTLLFIKNGHAVSLGEIGTLKPTFRSKTTRALSDADAATITGKLIRFYPGGGLKKAIAALPIEHQGKEFDVEDPNAPTT